jgi:hypothetical protein
MAGPAMTIQTKPCFHHGALEFSTVLFMGDSGFRNMVRAIKEPKRKDLVSFFEEIRP